MTDAPSPQRSFILPTVAAVAALAAVIVAGVNEPELRRVDGDGWSIEVPRSWERRAPNLFVGPDRANVRVEVRAIPLPMALFTDSTRRDLHELPGYVLEREEERRRPDGLYTHTLWGRYQHNTTPVAVVTGIYDAGEADKLIVTLTVVAGRLPENRAWFEAVLESVEPR